MNPVESLPQGDPPSPAEARESESGTAAAAPDAQPRVRSMHEGVAVWEGCGSCAAEPYWLAIGADLEPDKRRRGR